MTIDVGRTHTRESGQMAVRLDPFAANGKRSRASSAAACGSPVTFSYVMGHSAAALVSSERPPAAAGGSVSGAQRLPDPVRHVRGQASQLLAMARSEAIRGREETCRKRLSEAASVAGPETGIAFTLARSATLGLLELGLGNPQVAAEHFERCTAVLTALS